MLLDASRWIGYQGIDLGYLAFCLSGPVIAMLITELACSMNVVGYEDALPGISFYRQADLRRFCSRYASRFAALVNSAQQSVRQLAIFICRALC